MMVVFLDGHTCASPGIFLVILLSDVVVYLGCLEMEKVQTRRRSPDKSPS